MKNRFTLEMGDEIEVAGMRFILVEVASELNKPARVVFKQPIELVMEGTFTIGSQPTDVVLNINKSRNVGYSSEVYASNCPLCTFRIGQDRDRDWVEQTMILHLTEGHQISIINIEVRYLERI